MYSYKFYNIAIFQNRHVYNQQCAYIISSCFLMVAIPVKTDILHNNFFMLSIPELIYQAGLPINKK